MKKLMLILFLSVFVGLISKSAYAQNQGSLIANLGDVRIYHMGLGYYAVESDRVRQSFPLKITRKGGWVEIACSSVIQKFEASAIGWGVEKVVDAYLGEIPYAGYIARKVAEWATAQGIDYLCS